MSVHWSPPEKSVPKADYRSYCEWLDFYSFKSQQKENKMRKGKQAGGPERGPR